MTRFHTEYLLGKGKEPTVKAAVACISTPTHVNVCVPLKGSGIFRSQIASDATWDKISSIASGYYYLREQILADFENS